MQPHQIWDEMAVKVAKTTIQRHDSHRADVSRLSKIQKIKGDAQ
jgi:hypothetical protein